MADSIRSAEIVPIEQRIWIETRTDHFHIFSCGEQAAVNRLAGRLEQFCSAYAALAGTNAIDSPPIIVLAFPDHESLKPYLPRYNGRPGNVAAFFLRGKDENLIVLSLPGVRQGSSGMEVIFHEYNHLLFRHNDSLWPVWLREGMAEIYSTFQTDGHQARIAAPIPHHLQILHQRQLMPLSELFAVTPGSPEYNEADRQGVFYAESWLLTHFLMSGDNGNYRARFGQFTTLLRQGELPLTAFTNALKVSLPVIQKDLARYLNQGLFQPINLSLTADVSGPVTVSTRRIPPVEVLFRLGHELLRLDQPEAALARFLQARKMAPESPLPEEGLGILAHQQGAHDQAIQNLKSAIGHGSSSYWVYYLCALEEFQKTADREDHYTRLSAPLAGEIRDDLLHAISLMPSFGPAHQLCGIVNMLQGEALAEAGMHLQRAYQLEPENPSYTLSLAQYRYLTHDPTTARLTLEPLLRANADPKFRSLAESLRREMESR